MNLALWKERFVCVFYILLQGLTLTWVMYIKTWKHTRQTLINWMVNKRLLVPTNIRLLVTLQCHDGKSTLVAIQYDWLHTLSISKNWPCRSHRCPTDTNQRDGIAWTNGVFFDNGQFHGHFQTFTLIFWYYFANHINNCDFLILRKYSDLIVYILRMAS